MRRGFYGLPERIFGLRKFALGVLDAPELVEQLGISGETFKKAVQMDFRNGRLPLGDACARRTEQCLPGLRDWRWGGAGAASGEQSGQH
jgi:hypothetical protein